MKKVVKYVLFAVGGIFALGVILAIFGVGSPKKTDANAIITTTVSSTTVAPTTSTTKAISAVDVWLLAHAQIFAVLGKDESNVGKQVQTDRSSGNYSTVSQACAQLGVDAKTDESLPPIPQPQYAQQISQLLTNLSQASTLCVSGIANSDTNEMSQTVALLATANQEVATLTTEFNKMMQG